MAKFRSNYRKTSHKLNIGKYIRIVLVLGLVLLFILSRWLKNTGFEQEETLWSDEFVTFDYLPLGVDGELLRHAHFTINYNEDHEQANWVAYELTKEQLERKRVMRSRYFYADSLVSTGSAEWFDYKESNYTRGHLVPAADRGWNEEVMQSTFLMSNVSPQIEGFNGGVWREAEEVIRDWVIEKGHLYIVSGPVLDKCSQGVIGQKNRITVPCNFFKAVLYLDSEGVGQSIGFIFPHEVTEKPLEEFMVSIDSLENLLDMNFFSEMSINEIENESTFDMNFWWVDNGRFKKRINNWNKN